MTIRTATLRGEITVGPSARHVVKIATGCSCVRLTITVSDEMDLPQQRQGAFVRLADRLGSEPADHTARGIVAGHRLVVRDSTGG